MRAIGSRIALWVLALGATANAVAQTPAIQFAEPVALSLKSATAEFDAFGRRFSLTLEDNERVLSKLSRNAQGRARVIPPGERQAGGQPGSWVRLTQTPSGVEGAIWDGHDLYAVTRYDRIAEELTNPLDARPDHTVVYRLSDMRDALPQEFCALDERCPRNRRHRPRPVQAGSSASWHTADPGQHGLAPARDLADR